MVCAIHRPGPPPTLLGTDGFQEADTFGITMPIVSASFMIHADGDPAGGCHKAFHIARTGRPGRC